MPPADVGNPAQLGRGIQRTMTLLATSTPSHHNSVRLLFYGQSITEQDWWKEVVADLRARFPHADLIVENRALGGYSAQRLIKTAETDLYPFQPDLLIFHVYGSHSDYEAIIRRTRERTTAEILIQTDHINAKADWRNEPTDPAVLTNKQWDSFMNYRHLPEVISRYGCGYVDQRNLWKKHLRERGLEATALLRDGVHLNEEGCRVMAAFVKAALVVRSDGVPPDPMNCGFVRTHVIGRDLEWRGDQLRLEFDGNRIDLIGRDGSKDAVEITLDGRKPSAHPELYQVTRAQAKPGGLWPPFAPIGSEAMLQLEDWSMDVRPTEPGSNVFAFTVRGSRTGNDGSGRSDQLFVSKSRRVALTPAMWDVAYALGLAKVRPVPPAFTVGWKVVPRFADTWRPLSAQPGMENATIVAGGLADKRHTLELRGGRNSLKAIRVYAPQFFPRAQ